MIRLLYAGAEASETPCPEGVVAFARYGVGLLHASRETYCVLPPAFAATGKGPAAVASAALLLRALRRFAALREHTRSVHDTGAESTSGVVECNDPAWSRRFEASLSLVDDLLRNGVWRRDVVAITARPQGRIHWPRTVQSAPVYITQDQVLYDPPFRSRRAHDQDDLLWLVWVDCLRAAAALLGLETELALPLDTPRFRRSTALAACRDHGDRVFDDRGRAIVGWLRLFLEASVTGRDNTTPDLRWLRIDREEHLWEAVVRNAVTGSDRADHVVGLPPIPTGRWHTTGGLGASCTPRLDCRLEVHHGGETWLLIVDAKRYEPDSEITGGDLYKQWLYAFYSSDLHHSRGFPRDRIVNVLAMPGSEPAVARGTGVFRFDTGHEGDRWPGMGTVLRMELDYRHALELFRWGRKWPGLAESMLREWKRLLASRPA